MKGTEITNYGLVAKHANHRVVHIALKEGEKINPHDHIGEDVYFTVVKGKVLVFLDETEEHLMESGKVLYFDGEHSISAVAEQASDIFVYLIKKEN